MERLNAIEQIESIAQKAYEANPASQPASLGDKIIACVVIEDLVWLLSTYPPDAPQILNNVYVERQEILGTVPRVAVTATWEATQRFINTGNINYISLETHPEWLGVKGAADKRWLEVRGLCLDDPGTIWEKKYIFDNFTISKLEQVMDRSARWKELGTGLPVDQSDLNIISSICLGIRDQVGSLLTKSSSGYNESL